MTAGATVAKTWGRVDCVGVFGGMAVSAVGAGGPASQAASAKAIIKAETSELAIFITKQSIKGCGC